MTGPSFRPLRLLGWTLASVLGVAVTGFLVAAGTVMWMFGVALPRHSDERAEAEREMARVAGAAVPAPLAAAARDGRLTGDEIRAAVGGPVWDVQRSASRWLVRARFEGTDPVCFAYELTVPLGPDTRVTSTELSPCPAITPGG